jgi:xanthine/uracil/vitamin C permease (AzgA family)
VRVEVLAGLTTFLTMAYIIVVNPLILGDAGVPSTGRCSPRSWWPRSPAS